MNSLSFKAWVTWPRLVCLVVTCVILYFIFHKIGSTAFLAALQQTRVSWFVLGFVAYGLAIWLGSLRWHLALRLTDRAIHLSASSRLFLIGHFFYVVLFGAAGGDLAKSAVYARYFRFGIPEVIAAAPLDRIYGLGGNLLLAGLVAALTFFNGGFEEIANLKWHRPGLWFLGVVILFVLLGVGLIFWRPTGESSWARTIRALRSGGGRLILKPHAALPGIVVALLSITALTAVIALNLRAVSHTPLPWARLVWTFSAITILSSVPFTVAGAGVREIAALTFLGLYGVPAGECVAAALLTLLQKVAWGGVGAMVLWWEEALRAKRAGQPVPSTISVVIPTFDDAAVLPETVRRAKALPEVREVIVVDGNSHDGTRSVAEELGCRVFSHAAEHGERLRYGAAQATGDVVMLLHAGTYLPPRAGHAALNCLRDETVVAGGFWKKSLRKAVFLSGSLWKCAIRLLVGRRIAGDQALFIRRQTLEQIGGVPTGHVTEHLELCRRLRKAGRLALADLTLAGGRQRAAVQ